MRYEKGYKVVYAKDGKYYSCYAGRLEQTEWVKPVEYKVGEFVRRHSRKDGALVLFKSFDYANSWFRHLFAYPEDCELWECRYLTSTEPKRFSMYQVIKGEKVGEDVSHLDGVEYATAIKLVKCIGK